MKRIFFESIRRRNNNNKVKYEILPQRDDEKDIENYPLAPQASFDIIIRSIQKHRRRLFIGCIVVIVLALLRDILFIGLSYLTWKGYVPISFIDLNDAIMANYDLRNIPFRNDDDPKTIVVSNKTNFINTITTYLPPKNNNKIIITPDDTTLFPNFNVNPYLSLPLNPTKHYPTCSFNATPKFDHWNVIDFSHFKNYNNPWHCINQDPLDVWCLYSAISKYSNYYYTLSGISPSSNNNPSSSWCAQLANLVVTTNDNDDVDVEFLPKHYLRLTKFRSFHGLLPTLFPPITSNFYSFDTNQKPLVDLQQFRAVVPFLPQDDCNNIEGNYALLVQRKKTRAIVDKNTYKFDTIVQALIDIGIPIKTAEFDTISLREQMQLVCHSKLLIAVHGAALENMLWLPSEGKSGVIEILLRNKWCCHDEECTSTTNHCIYSKGDYFNLAKYLNITYKYYDPTYIPYRKTSGDPNEYLATKAVYIDSDEFASLVFQFWNTL